MKVSVLIPVYNFAIAPLVADLRAQAEGCRAAVEIILLEDGSEDFVEENRKAAIDFGCTYSSQVNAGRAVTRNRLAKMATGDWLLFLDCDSKIPANYLNTYFEVLSPGSVFYGGTNYFTHPPEGPYMLHWKFGMKREALPPKLREKNPYLSFKSNNFIVESDRYLSCPMDSEITKYGYEDLLWALELKKKSTAVIHIDNPVLHLGLNTAGDFIKKTSESIENLHSLMKMGKLDGSETPLLRWHRRLRKMSAIRLIWALGSISEKVLMKNFHSKRPSLFLLDVYKLFLLERSKPI